MPRLLAEHNGSITTGVIYGPGNQPIEQVTNAGVVLWLHADQLGTIRATTNSSGTVTATMSYDAFGKRTAATGTPTNLLGYNGQYEDAETGFVYLRARYYDPTTNQFAGKDPITWATEAPFTYAGSDPVNNADPTGLWCLHHTGGGCVGGSVVHEVVNGAQWVQKHPATVLTGAAIIVCIAASFGACAVASGAALVARVGSKIQRDGFRDSATANVADILLTGATLGVGGAFESAAGEVGTASRVDLPEWGIWAGTHVPSIIDLTGVSAWKQEARERGDNS